jgi:hypothetical protein
MRRVSCRRAASRCGDGSPQGARARRSSSPARMRQLQRRMRGPSFTTTSQHSWPGSCRPSTQVTTNHHPAGRDHAFKTRMAAFITALTPELAAELTGVAEDFLARHQIRDEPPELQPPTTILNGLDLPGADLASLDLNAIHKLASTDGAPAAAIARRFGTTSDAIQALLLDDPAPADPAGGARRRRARYDISREQLRDLHHERGLSFTEIGQRTGYSRTAINDLARTYGMPARTCAPSPPRCPPAGCQRPMPPWRRFRPGPAGARRNSTGTRTGSTRRSAGPLRRSSRLRR